LLRIAVSCEEREAVDVADEEDGDDDDDEKHQAVLALESKIA